MSQNCRSKPLPMVLTSLTPIPTVMTFQELSTAAADAGLTADQDQSGRRVPPPSAPGAVSPGQRRCTANVSAWLCAFSHTGCVLLSGPDKWFTRLRHTRRWSPGLRRDSRLWDSIESLDELERRQKWDLRELCLSRTHLTKKAVILLFRLGTLQSPWASPLANLTQSRHLFVVNLAKLIYHSNFTTCLKRCCSAQTELGWQKVTRVDFCRSARRSAKNRDFPVKSEFDCIAISFRTADT